ncbi:MAG: hypothetical protein VB071_01195, partial [Lawsonibacter sp.]|nr:hypothetical protein [Lawsonibacter sp.]
QSTKGAEPELEGINKTDSREGIRAYARGRAYIPGRFDGVTPYIDPNGGSPAQKMDLPTPNGETDEFVSEKQALPEAQKLSEEKAFEGETAAQTDGPSAVSEETNLAAPETEEIEVEVEEVEVDVDEDKES